MQKRVLLHPHWFQLVRYNSFGMNGGDDETRTRDLCRDRYHDLETQVLTGSSKEHKVVKTRRREFLLFPDRSHDCSVGFRNQIRGRIGPDAWREREITWSWFYKELRGSRWTEMEGLCILRHSHCRPFAASFSHPTFLLGGSISRTLLFASRMASGTACL